MTNIDLGRLLARHVPATLDVTYQDIYGATSRRQVRLDKVHGRSLYRPDYIAGLDSLSREKRHFRVDRIAVVHGPSGDVSKEVPECVGYVVRQALGVLHQRPAFDVDISRQVRIVQERCGLDRILTGTVNRFKFIPTATSGEVKTFIRAKVTGSKSPPKAFEIDLLATGDADWEVTSLHDLESNANIDEPITWAAKLAGVTAL